MLSNPLGKRNTYERISFVDDMASSVFALENKLPDYLYREQEKI
jgi:methenyltetrahydromethanopterin cyclohydrolase